MNEVASKGVLEHRTFHILQLGQFSHPTASFQESWRATNQDESKQTESIGTLQLKHYNVQGSKHTLCQE